MYIFTTRLLLSRDPSYDFLYTVIMINSLHQVMLVGGSQLYARCQAPWLLGGLAPGGQLPHWCGAFVHQAQNL